MSKNLPFASSSIRFVREQTEVILGTCMFRSKAYDEFQKRDREIVEAIKEEWRRVAARANTVSLRLS